MSWVRIDDHFPDHPKIVSAGPLGAWLYVAGLCYCNRLLTNGFIPMSQVDRLLNTTKKSTNISENLRIDSDRLPQPTDTKNSQNISANRRTASDRVMPPSELEKSTNISENLRIASTLCELGLWCEVKRKGIAGFLVHDYLKYQPSKAKILAKRAQSAVRQERFRHAKSNAVSNAVSNGVSNAQRNAVSNAAPNPNPNPNPKEEKKKSGGSSPRPIYTSDRFAVFEWQLDELSKVLGSNLDAFDLHAFFDGLSQQSRESGLVIPRDRVWEWLQAQVVAEAQRRGLPMIRASPALGKSNTRLAAALANIKREAES